MTPLPAPLRWLHSLEWRRGLVRAKAGVIAMQSVRHGAGCAAWKYGNAKAALVEFFCALYGSFSSFNHIGQKRNATGKALASGIHLLGGAQCLDEKRVDSAGKISFRAIKRGINPLDCQGVGSSQNQGARAMASVYRSLELAAHFGHRHDGFPVKVTTALGKTLVLNLNHRRARTLKTAHCALGVERITEASVCIDDDRRTHTFGNASQRIFNLRVGREPHIRASQMRVGNGRARKVQGLKTGLLGQ